MVGGWYYDPECTQFVMGPLGSFVPTEDVTVYAKWVDAAVITYNANGGYLFGNPNVTSEHYHMPIGEPMHGNNVLDEQEVQREGYTFAGWCLDASRTGDVLDMYNYTPTADVTLYAKWVTGFTVTFDANGRTFPQLNNQETYSVNVESGQRCSDGRRSELIYDLDASMVVTGWFDNPACTGNNYMNGFVPNEDMYLYAKWNEGWTVTLNANGGWFEEDRNITTQYLVACKEMPIDDTPSIIAHAVPKRDGMIVTSWNTHADGSGDDVGRWLFYYVPNENVTLYAQWSEAWTITWDANGYGFWGDMSVTSYSEVIQKGDAVGYSWPGAKPINGMIYAGWYLDAACTGEPVDVGSYYPNSDTTFYAKWSEAWTVTFDGNGGHMGLSEQAVRTYLVLKGGQVHVEPEPRNGDLVFAGWYPNTDFVGEPTFVWDYIPKSDVTFYAKWSEGVQLTLNANGGYYYNDPERTVWTTQVPKGYTSPLYGREPGQPRRDDGLVFAGWYDNPECTGDQKYPFSYEPTYLADTTFYAKYAEAWTVTFEGMGGIFWWVPGMTSITVDVIKGQPVNSNPVVNHQNGQLRFAGWYLTADYTGDAVDPLNYVPESDVTLYAKWSEGISVTFDANGRTFEQLDNQTTYVQTVSEGESVYGEAYVVTYYPMGGYFWGNTNDTNPWVMKVSMGQHAGYNGPNTPNNGNLAFAGWYLSDDYSGDKVVPWEYYPDHDVNFYAKWVDGYTVTLDANGYGFYNNIDYKTHTIIVVQGEAIVAGPATDDIGGMTFAGWYLDAACTEENRVGEYISGYVLTSDVTIYAKWVRADTITFFANGGTFPTRGEDTLTAVVTEGDYVGDLVATYAETPIWDGYEFTGWYCEANDTYYSDESYLAITSDMTLLAQWTAIQTEPMGQMGMRSMNPMMAPTDDEVLSTEGNEPAANEPDTTEPAAEPAEPAVTESSSESESEGQQGSGEGIQSITDGQPTDEGNDDATLEANSEGVPQDNTENPTADETVGE